MKPDPLGRISEPVDTAPGAAPWPPPRPCVACGGSIWWKDRYRQATHCARCEPPPSRAVILKAYPRGCVVAPEELVSFRLPDGTRIIARKGFPYRGPNPDETWEEWENRNREHTPEKAPVASNVANEH